MVFVWLLLYGAVMLLSRYFAPMTPWAVPAGLFVCTAALIVWLPVKQKKAFLGLGNLSFARWKRQLFFLPYLLPVAYNIYTFGFHPQSVPVVLGIFLAAGLEELLFRGILLEYFCRRGAFFGVALSSLVFAAAHLVNIENGVAPMFLFCQLLFALAAGFSLSGIVLTCGSLLPCIGIHFLINLTASAASPESDPLFWLCIAVYFACGFRSIHILHKANSTKKGCLNETLH